MTRPRNLILTQKMLEIQKAIAEQNSRMFYRRMMNLPTKDEEPTPDA
jgi:hypothetical protein